MYSKIKWLVLISTCSLLFGRAWQFIVWDAPFRTLLWDEAMMSSIIVPTFFETWNAYVTSPASDQFINNMVTGFGILYLATGILLIFYKHIPKITKFLLLISTLGLMILFLLYWKEKFYQIGQFIEYASQLLMPVLAYFILFKNRQIFSMTLWIKIAIALTFIGHGLYAIGYHPQPGHFVDMFLNVFGISEPMAKNLLYLAGVLDMIAAIALFIPGIELWAIWYVFFWAGATTCARLLAHIDFNFFFYSMNQWLFEFLIRIPHIALPLLLLIWKHNSNSTPQNTHT